ncbi:MAG TPA: hypothetical protein VLJ11_09525 [Bryobacteraceae bacterium]|nr:hypothetical protein [Bryobacteraceae bacterium]
MLLQNQNKVAFLAGGASVVIADVDQQAEESAQAVGNSNPASCHITHGISADAAVTTANSNFGPTDAGIVSPSKALDETSGREVCRS